MGTGHLRIALLLAAAATAAACTPSHREVDNPLIEAATSMTMDIPRVEMTDSTTVLHVDLHGYPDMKVRLDSTSVLKAGNETFAFKRAEGFTMNKWVKFPKTGLISFTMTFQPIPMKSKTMDFIESGDGFKLFGIDLFRQDPTLFYAWAKDFVYGLDAFRPSVVHTTLAALEARGLLGCVVTQNIDRLHTLAGSRTVHELHGSPQWHHCLTCGRAYPYEAVAPTAHQGLVPHCDNCGGVLKPDIVFYGESLPEETLLAALDACRHADLILVLGSSLTVYPAAALPKEGYDFGARLAIVNDAPTPLDTLAILRLPDLAATFGELATLLR